MKFRYLKITTGDMIWGTNDLKVTDLADRKLGHYEAILDLENMTYYDPEINEWKVIEGEF